MLLCECTRSHSKIMCLNESQHNQREPHLSTYDHPRIYLPDDMCTIYCRCHVRSLIRSSTEADECRINRARGATRLRRSSKPSTTMRTSYNRATWSSAHGRRFREGRISPQDGEWDKNVIELQTFSKCVSRIDTSSDIRRELRSYLFCCPQRM